jgi:hypothetical protein
MAVAVSLPLLVAALLAVGARRTGRALPPAVAVPALTLAAFVTALACGFVLTAVAFGYIAQIGALDETGHWSVHALRTLDPVPPPIGITAAVLATAVAASAARGAVHVAENLWRAETTCRRLGPAPGGLVVVDGTRPEAFALAAISTRIVISTAMLRALSPDERSVLLAHETSHARRRHHIYTLATDLAATANPLLRPVAAAVRAAVERWADEDAAAAVGDRPLTARALARGALTAGRPRSTRPGGLAAGGGDIVARTRALLAPPPRPRRLLTATILLLTALSVTGGIATAHDTEHRFEQAQAAYTSN